jgi:glutathione S-transferase
MMKLYWSQVSPYVRKVLICAHELGLADRIEIVPAKVAMTVPNHALMRANPLGKVPALVDENENAYFDSLVICDYLNSLAPGSGLFPAAGAERWDALRWHAIGNGMSDALILWFRELLRPEEHQLAELVDILKLKICACLPVLEQESARVCAQPLHIGHVAVYTALAYIDFRFPEIEWRSGHPQLSEWVASIGERDSAKATAPR